MIRKKVAAYLLCLFFAVNGFSQSAVDIDVDASAVTGQFSPLWGDHYDLSIVRGFAHFPSDPNFGPIMNDLAPRYWRCSVGRWEVGHPVPTGGTSLDTAVLKTVEREYYRGGNNLADSDNPANYDFTYLDEQLDAITATGAEPFLSFDYMPFTLSSQKDPGNPFNFSLSTSHTFANGIRTAPPATPAVYARVVRNVVRHVRGQFGGTKDYGIEFIEIGNEPEFDFFWTGSEADFATMYAFIAAEIDADAQINNLVQLGAASFAFPDPNFANLTLAGIAGASARIDFVSYHSYHDDPFEHYNVMTTIGTLRDAHTPGKPLINGEWGRELPTGGPGDPVYDEIAHGLFRVKTMILFQLGGVKQAHESLFIDPGGGPGELGLLGNAPIRSKPASDCYRAMNLLNDCLNAVNLVTTPSGDFGMAGRNAAADKITIAYVADELSPGSTKSANLKVANLPWSGTYYTARYEVSQSTWQNSEGVKLVNSGTSSSYPFTETVSWAAGESKLVIWQLSKNPLIGMNDPAETRTGLRMIPNPNAGNFRLDCRDFPAGKARMEVSDMAGNLVLEQTVWIRQNELPEVDFGELKDGVYSVELIGNTERRSGKIVLQR